MMILHSFAPAFGEPSASPFCTKAMALLNMAGLKYGADWDIKWQMDPRKTPKQKFPVLVDGAQTIADTAFIRRHLEDSKGVDFDAGLTATQKAQARLLIHLAEDHLYWMLVTDRWRRADNWAKIKGAFFGKVPVPVRWILPHVVRRQTLSQAWGQGMGRHSDADICHFAHADFAAIKTLLGDQPFLFGAKPTSADASVAPVLSAMLAAPCPTPLFKELASHDQLKAYCERFGREVLGDVPRA